MHFNELDLCSRFQISKLGKNSYASTPVTLSFTSFCANCNNFSELEQSTLYQRAVRMLSCFLRTHC